MFAGLDGAAFPLVAFSASAHCGFILALGVDCLFSCGYSVGVERRRNR